MKFCGFSDEKLCELARSGVPHAEEELVLRYRNLVNSIVRPYFLTGGDSEDLIQEGMIGLLSAVRAYTHGKETLFKTFAFRCISNRILSAVKIASRRMPVGNFVPLEALLDTASSRLLSQTPEDYVLDREAFLELSGSLKDLLSPLERRILGLYFEGLSYQAISDAIGKSVKAVDNAIQRIRKKLQSIRR